MAVGPSASQVPKKGPLILVAGFDVQGRTRKDGNTAKEERKLVVERLVWQIESRGEVLPPEDRWVQGIRAGDVGSCERSSSQPAGRESTQSRRSKYTPP